MPEKHKVILSPAASPYRTPDSVLIPADCGHQAWIAPSSLNMVLNPFMATETLCMRCLPADTLRDAIAAGELRAIPGAKDELAEVIGRDVADQLYRDMGVNEDPIL